MSAPTTTPKKHSRITGADREQMAAAMVRDYAAGAPIRDIAERHGRSYGFVHRILVEAKVELRPRGGRLHKRVNPADAAADAAIAATS